VVLPLLALVLAGPVQEAPAMPAPVVIDGAPEVHEVPPPEDLVGRLPRPKMFDLTRYSLYAERRLPDATDGLNFTDEIEVFGRAKDPNEALGEYWRHWNFEYSVYGHGINVQATPNGGFNILPLVDWLRRKARGENPDLWGRTRE
jgi:hypothetical protein